ncbi:hypothetical protein [Xanthomonas vasicola]|uniref:hypothetical protein n=1 Tax=Xanthomonas vasicola TaxID=56459 RepID=UPI001C9731DF|nr:hypothetical protein [Xanthomonas vasicola]
MGHRIQIELVEWRQHDRIGMPNRRADFCMHSRPVDGIAARVAPDLFPNQARLSVQPQIAARVHGNEEQLPVADRSDALGDRFEDRNATASASGQNGTERWHRDRASICNDDRYGGLIGREELDLLAGEDIVFLH